MRSAIPGAWLLLAATAVLGCSPPEVSPVATSPVAATPTTAPPTASPPTAASPTASPSGPASFVWAARPDLFPGQDGGSLTSLAVGPNGLIALSVRDQDDGRTMRLWGSADGTTWQSINPTGLPERVYISGLWGAAGLYWLRGSLPDSDDPGILYRSPDGLAWRPSRSLKSDFFFASVADSCQASTERARCLPTVFLIGTKEVDGVIWRSTDGGDTWARATIDDATGWKGVQDVAPVEMLGVVVTPDGLLAFGNGLANASDTGGYRQSRFWRSTDGGVTWSRVPNAAPLGELLVHDVVVADRQVVAVGEGVADQIAVALTSTDGGRTWARSATSGIDADGNISQVLIGGDGYVGLGFADPAAADDFPLHESFWTSVDGASWSTRPAGDLEGGIVNDAVRFDEVIIAVGRAWTTDETGTWGAAFGPAVWTLAP
jgi:hypothetical protein